MEKISVVIAARNEETRIGDVLAVLIEHPLVDDVVVMCDNCSDGTAEVARGFGVHVIEGRERLGKTMAVKKGLEYAKNDILVLLDADLNGLTLQDITRLVKPVIDGQVDFTLSMRGNSSHIYKLFGIDFVSGERAISKRLLLDPHIWSKPLLGYGLEVLMNDSLVKAQKTFRSIPMPGLHATTKKEKKNYIIGTLEDFFMTFNIFRALPVHKVVWQFLKMSYLNRKYRKNRLQHSE
ncbi:MAG: glycosyltransferase family 2 protein [Coriobacteriia bacterium]|nr:glycosyltransferase family 2 protein [Coriobacteriia bacterium]